MQTKLTKYVKEFLTNDGWEYLYVQDRHRYNIPEISGIYCFLRWDEINDYVGIVYIGKSKNFANRLKLWHTVERKFDNEKGILFCYIKPSNEIDELEKFYITKFTPMFNIQHNPKISRKIIYEYSNTCKK